MTNSELASYLQMRGVRLQRHGIWLRACCPFHSERTPSFFVYDTHAHCYGCGAHLRDVVDAIWKLEFPNDKNRGNAFRVAREMHFSVQPLPIQLPRESPAPTEEQLIAMEVATTLWHEYLLQKTTGEPARAWLDERGLHGPLMAQIWPQLGYAPQGPRACATLERRLRERLGERWWDVATSIGLLSQHGYFLYRNRLILTTQRKGRVVFFQGRTLEEDMGIPKYLNPFVIRRVSFIPIPYTASIYAGTAICEGPLDAYTLAASGIYAIGLAGSNLKSLKRAEVEGPVFDYLDNEPEGKAGAEASKKLREWCETHHLPYQKADYPDDIKDPIRWVSAYGPESLVRAHQLMAA